MHLSTVECVLEYLVKEPAHFCFNIEAAHWPQQDILSEALALPPGVQPRHFMDERSGNRFIRFDVAAGLLWAGYAAMLGYFDIVSAILSDFPEMRDALGPHGIPLVEHARVGGADARAVLGLLEATEVSG